MSCPVCNTSPCICGDSYYKLTDEGFLAHLSIIKRIAHDRKLNTKITIDDIDIDDYINNVNLVVDTSVSLTNMLTNFMTVPEYFMKRLTKCKGQSVVKFFDEVKDDFDFIGFPLLVMTKLVLPSKDNRIQLRKQLILDFYNNLVDVDYELMPPIVPYKIDDFFSNSRDTEQFNQCVYSQRNAYAALANDADDRPEVAAIMRKYHTGMKCIEEILNKDQQCFDHCIEFLCASVPEGAKLFEKYKSIGTINNQIRDDLQNANYAFCKELDNVIAGDLRV